MSSDVPRNHVRCQQANKLQYLFDGKVVEFTVAFFSEAVHNIGVHFRELILDGNCSVGSVAQSMCLMKDSLQYLENKITRNSELSCC